MARPATPLEAHLSTGTATVRWVKGGEENAASMDRAMAFKLYLRLLVERMEDRALVTRLSYADDVEQPASFSPPRLLVARCRFFQYARTLAAREAGCPLDHCCCGTHDAEELLHGCRVELDWGDFPGDDHPAVLAHRE